MNMWQVRWSCHFYSTSVKPFSQIPGPRHFPILGTLPFKFFQPSGHAHLEWEANFKRYGPIYREKVGALDMVMIMDVSAIEKVHRSEGKYPKRMLIDPWIQWKNDNNKPLGLFTSDGCSWQRARSQLAGKLLRPGEVDSQLPRFHAVAREFVAALRLQLQVANERKVANLDKLLFRWSLETIGLMLFERRLHGLTETPDFPEFTQAVNDVFYTTELLSVVPGPIRNLLMRNLVRLHDRSWTVILDTSERLVLQNVAALQSRQAGPGAGGAGAEATFLEHALEGGKLSTKEIVSSISEIMLAAVDTTSNTMLWLLYLLGRHPHVQDELHRQICRTLADGDGDGDGAVVVTGEHVRRLPLVKAVVKETLRLYPITGVLTKRLDHDVVLCGYNVPAGKNILPVLWMTHRNSGSFARPLEFLPRRWLRDSADTDDGHGGHKLNSFAYLPFAFGPRSCIGRRIAELEMNLLVIELVRLFRIVPYTDEPLKIHTRSLLVPEKPPEILFIDRS